MTQGLDLIRKLGRFVEFSVFGAETTLDWSIIGDRKELDVRGAHLGPYCYPIAIDLLARGLVTSKGIVTHGFSLEEWDEAIEIAELARFDQGAAEAARLSVERGRRHGSGIQTETVWTTSSASTSARRAPRRCWSISTAAIVAQHASSYQPDTPKPLWAEQWPQVWLDAVVECIARMRRYKRTRRASASNSIKAVCVSSLYGGSGIPVDERHASRSIRA